MNNREKLIERIRKLLALASDKAATEAEAISAALKAQRLMAENDVEDWEMHVSDEQPIESASSMKVKRRWRWQLAAAVAVNFRCKHYEQTKRREPEIDGYGRVKYPRCMVFFGYKSDAEAAALTFDCLYSIGDRLASNYEKQAYRSYGSARGVYNGFVAGYVTGIRKELEKQSQALMIIVPPKVIESYEVFSADFGTVNSSLRIDKTQAAADAYREGEAAGRDAVRSRRMESADDVDDVEEADAGHLLGA